GQPLLGRHDFGLDVGQGPVDQWLPGGLAPGNYQVRTHTDGPITRSIALHPSDLLLLELAPAAKAVAPGALAFRRALYSQTHYPLKDKQTSGNWLLSLLQNQRKTDGGVQMLLALEKK